MVNRKLKNINAANSRILYE